MGGRRKCPHSGAPNRPDEPRKFHAMGPDAPLPAARYPRRSVPGPTGLQAPERSPPGMANANTAAFTSRPCRAHWAGRRACRPGTVMTAGCILREKYEKGGERPASRLTHKQWPIPAGFQGPTNLVPFNVGEVLVAYPSTSRRRSKKHRVQATPPF